MPNLRIISDNAADRCASITASTTAGTLVAGNLLTDLKGQVHRSTVNSVSYSASWAASESIGAVALPATNLTASATIRVRLYSDAAFTTQIADSGTVSACAGLNLGMWGWTAPRNASAFAYGGASKSAVWLGAQYSARSCLVDLADSANPAGYIDCARLVIGGYFEPAYNASYGAQAGIADTSVASRNDAGDLLADRGTLHDTLSVSLQFMPEADRAALLKIIRTVGASRNLFLSLLPGNVSSVAEQDHMVYGKRSNSALSFDVFNAFSNKLDMEGW